MELENFLTTNLIRSNLERKLISRFGTRSGLKLTFNINKKEYVGALAESYGIRLALHATGQTGHPDTDGYNVAADESTEIAIKYEKLQATVLCNVQKFKS